MLTRNKKLHIGALLVVLAGLTVPAGASLKDFRYDLAYVLDYAGFSQDLTYDNYFGEGTGWTYSFGQSFNNQEYQFGSTTINLNGALTGEFSISHKGYREISFDLETPTPIQYTYEAFVGDRKLHIDNGVFNASAKVKINQFGIYNIQIDATNVGTLVEDGPVSTAIPLDYTVGPINVQGQWLIDVINMTLGKELGFVLPGGAADYIVSNLFAIPQSQIDEALATAKTPAAAGMSIRAIPEPVSLTLMLLGAGLLARRRK